jgi:hypothetical protein
VNQAEAFKHPDNVAGEIELPPVEPLKGSARKCVMIIMPTLTESQ